MKRLLPAICASLCVSFLFAQKVDMQLFSTKDISFVKPRLIGKTGSHYMVYDAVSGWPSAVYTFDSSFKWVNTTKQYISTPLVSFHVSGTNVFFTWKSQKRDSATFSASVLDEYGNERWFNQHTVYYPAAAAFPPKLATDVNKKFFVYYSVVADSSDANYVRAVMLDTNWNVVKSGFYPVHYDRKATVLTPVMVDVNGDMHFATYDRLGSYRLSSILTMHTIPLDGPGKDSLLTQRMGIDKVKFFDLSFVDDTVQQAVKLVGYYYDGQEKLKRGIASLRFPYERPKPVTASYYPFPANFENDLRKSLTYLHKKENPGDNLRIKDVFEYKGKLYVSNWLVDMPRYQMKLDKDLDREFINTMKDSRVYSSGSSGVSPSLDGWLRNSVNFNRSTTAPLVIDPRNPGVLVGPGYVPVFTSPIGGPASDMSLDRVYTNMATHLDPSIMRQMENREVGKMLYFSIDEQGTFQNQLVPYMSSFMSAGGLNNYPLLSDGQLYFLNDIVRDIGTKKKPSIVKQVEIVQYNSRGEAGKIGSFDADLLATFYSPAIIAPGKYIGLYQNKKSGENGLALWQVPATTAK